MMVPTGSAFLATRTLGPSGTAGAALACCAPAPANMFLAMTAVTTAMTSAPTSSATFFTSMANSHPPCGPLEQPHTSDKFVKKPLGENRTEDDESPRSDRHAVWNLGSAIAAAESVTKDNTERQDASGNRHPDQKFHRGSGREPEGNRRGELDIAAAHHAGIESSGEDQKDDRARR